MDSKPKSRKLQAGIALFVLAVIIVAGSVATKPKMANTSLSQTSTNSSSSNKTTNTPSTKSTTADASNLNGTYSAEGSYDSPGGTEKIKVTITLASSVVTATSATSEANDPTASQYQSYFISSYKSQVVGKKITDIKLSNVSGSSLTSQGFNEAVKNIISKAETA
jgi:uncharacterized protein with FMN-binding domain